MVNLLYFSLQDVDSNFPPIFNRHMIAQAKEIARQCVDPPLKRKPNSPPFKPEPSLKRSIAFLIDCIKRLPKENCGYCKEECFPPNPDVRTAINTIIIYLFFMFSFSW